MSLFLDGYKRPKNKKKDEKKTEGKKPQSSSASRVNERASNSTFMGGGASVQKVKQNSTAPTKPRSSNNQQTSTTTQQSQTGTGRRTTTTRHTPTSRERISQRQTDTATGSKSTNTRHTPSAKEMLQQRKNEENERKRNRDANLNLKQTQAAESRRRAKEMLNTVDNAARNLGDRANKWEKENLSARNPMLETQRTVKNQKAAKEASERQQKKFEKLDKADQEAVKAKMQESSLGRAVGNASDRWIEREKGILHSSASTLADFGDMLNDEKSNKRGRIAEDYAGLLPDAKETKRQMRQAYADYADKADKSAARLSKLTDKAASNVIEKKFYEAEDVAQGMISDKALSILTGGNWAIPLFMRTYSQAKREAEKNGATEAEARVSGLLNSAIEIGTEGAGGYFGKGDKLLGKLGSKLENRIVNKFEGETAKKVASFIARWERNNIEESLEEVIGNPLQNLTENIVYRNRVQNERVAQESDSLGELGASIQKTFAENPTEVERYIAELNSPDTRDSFVKDFMQENGLDKKQADTAADKMLAFMQAAATNDVKQMEEIRASLSQDLAGDTKKKVFDWRENLNAVLISHLVGVGSGVNAASTMAQGQAILDAPNSKGAMQNALSKTAAFSKENSAKAKGLLETMEKDDYTPTATQAYDIMANENAVMAESAERQRAAEQVKEKAIKRENLSVPVSTVRADGKHIITGEQTTERYLNRAVDTFELVDAINSSIHNESEKVSDDVAQKMADIVPSFDVGTLDVSHTAELTTDHTEERYIFKEMTGVDLNQFNVYDKNGNLDAVASNINMQKGLLAMSAQNYIESARIEQLAWNDQARGQIADVLGSKFNPQGDIAIHDALESVDPRDQSKFMLMTRVAQDVYRNAYTTTDSWQEVKRTYQKLYPSLNIDALEGMYESAKADRAEDETPYLNYEVKAGEALDSISKGDAKPQIRGKFVNDTPYNAETGEGRILAESDRIVLASMAKGINANITMIDAEDDRLAYTDEYGDTKYNNASVDLATGDILLSNACDIGTAIHEVTHVGARLASRYYRDLADYIFDMAYKHDPEKTMRILDAYRRSYADQNLSDAKLKEEAVSDLVAAFQNDPRFARDMAQGDPSIIRKIINAIEDLLRSLRNILATGKIQDPAVQNSFLVEIGAYEDARKMWLRMYREAQKNSAALGIAQWHEDQIRDNRVANARHTNVEQAEKERELFFRDSDGNGLTERQAQIVHDVGPDIRFSRPTFLNDLAKGEYYAGLNNGTGGFAGLREIASGKDILIRTMRNNGFGEDQTNAVVGFLTHMADYLDGDDLHMKYSFIGWQDLSDAEITVRRDKDDNIVGVAVSAMVANGEYPVNFDMTTICNKREGVMEVIQELTRKYDADTGRTILNSIKLTDEKMWSINEALKAEGIDTACLGCFVEARRYYTNRFIDKIDDVWNSAVRDARKKLGLPEEEYFNFAKGKKVSGEDYNRISDLWTAYDESTEAKRSPAQRIKILMDEIVRNKEVDSPYLKLISAEDILTPEGIDGFKRISTKDRDMVKMIKSIYGTSAPKEILAFTPYNSEIALLPDKIKGKDAGAYLRSIGGTRVQSFSDFKMAHMFDHMQMVADEAARRFVNHGYSKVIAYPKLFGLTGRKINMSVMFDVLPASEWQSVLGCSEEAAKEIAKKYQGLRFVKELPEWYGVEGHEKNDNRPYIETEIEGVHGYLTYLVSDADYVNSVFDELYQQYIAEGMDADTARREANKAKPFEQSINYREAVALENQEGYKENVGIIAVAYGDEHLKILLDDPNVRYIIPYHRSGLPVFIAQKTALDIARDYTDSQNTRKAKRGMWFDKDGTKFNLKARYKNFKAEYEQAEHPEGSFPAIEFFKEISQLTFDNPVLTEDEINEKIEEYIKTLPTDISEEQKSELVKKQRKKLKKKDASLAGTGSFDVYKDLDKVSDIREISNAYLEHCINKNQVPIFYDFASHPNYYKMLFDFAVTDAEGNIYPQRPVRNVYPGLDIDAKVAAGEEITEEDYAEFYKAIEEGLQTENAKNELRSNRLGKVLDEDLLSREGENSIIADSNIQHIVNGTPDYTNPKSSDVANSRDVDADYMAAVEAGDMETAQRLVEEAAKRVGYKTPRLYHGTPNFGFTVFDGTGFRDHDGWFFSDRKDAAESYAYGEEAGTYSVYLNLENPLVIDADGQDWTDIQTYTSLEARDRAKEIDARLDEIRDAWRNGTDNGEYDRLLDELDELDSESSSGDTDSWVELAKENGHDGLIIKNIIDYGASYEGEEYEPFTEYIAFNQEQIKSADPVTYDDAGNVIPLSERFNQESQDIRYSRLVELDESYMQAVNSGNMDEAQRLVDEAAGIAGMRVAHRYHGTMNAGFTVFDKAYAKVGGNSGAGFYFSTEEDDSINHYQDVEGADNYFKWSSLADRLWEEGYYEDLEIIDHDHAVEIAKELMNQNPGTYDVYLNYKNPYIRNGRQSTNIFNTLEGSFDDSVIDRNDYDSKDDYDDAWHDAYYEHIYDGIYNAVYGAYSDLEDFYDILDAPDVSKVTDKLAEHAIDYESLTWDEIENAVWETELIRDGWTEQGYGAPEFARAIIENFGFDAIEDKEVSSKFGQLSREMMTDTEHIIVFRPEQIKLSDPVTYAEDGSVIPLSERFDPNNNDIRYSRPTIDADGNILTDGQMEYFKNSQARDSQGRLVPVYHTTNKGGFSVFDPMRSDDHRSLFFASNWDVSQTYGNYANSRFYNYGYDITDIDDVRKFLDNYSPDRYFITQEQFEQAGGWEADFVDFENITDGKQSDFEKYLENPDGYIAIVGVPDYSPDSNSYADTWVMANTPDELVRELHDYFGRQQITYSGNSTVGKQHGYYACYLNLENPLIIDAHGANWTEVPYTTGSENPIRQQAFDAMRRDSKYEITEIRIAWKSGYENATLMINTMNGPITQDFNDGLGFGGTLDAIESYWTDGLGMSPEYLSYVINHMGGAYHYIPENKEESPIDYIGTNGNRLDYEEYFDKFNVDDEYDYYDYSREGSFKTREIAEIAQSEGYDGVIIRNLIDIGDASEFEGSFLDSDIYIAFSSNQVKDINNENPTSDPDIRYSRTVDDEAMSHMAHDYAYDNSYEALAHYEEMIATDEPDETVYQKAKNYIAKDVDRFYSGLTRYADGMRFDDPVLEEGRTRMARSKQDFFNSNKAKWNDRWLTDGEVLDIKSVEKAVRDLVTGTMLNSNTNRKYSQETVKKTLMDMRLAYFYAKQGRTDIADALLWHSAHRMIDGVEFYREDGNFETYKKLRDYFKDAKLQLGEDYWNDVDYAAFRKMNFGRLNLVRGKTNLDKILDDLYHENSDGSIEGIAVEWFNPEAFEKNNYKIDSVPDILLQIADVLDTVEPYAEAYSSEYCAEWATDIASDLLDIMQSGKELQSTADKYKNRYDEKAKAMKARHAEAMLKVRQQRDEGIKREKVKLKEYVERQREKKAHTKYFQGIQKSYNALKERLLTNTADKNIPEQYKKDLARLLAAFDLQTVGSKKYEARTGRQGKNTIKMAAVRVALRNIENKTGEFHVSDAVTDIIDELMGEDTGNGSNRSIEGLTIDELSVSELARIDKLLKALVHEFNTYRYVKVKAKRMQVEDIGKAQVEDALNHADKFGRRKDYHNFTGVLDKIINMGEMTPAYMFRYIDPNNVGLGMMWKEIRRSFDRYVRNQNQLNEWMDEIVGQYHQKGLLWNKYGSGELSNWRSINYQETFTLENGHSVALTPAQMMSLYCLSKRNQAYNHMTGAGIIVAPVSFQAKVISDIKKKADMSLPEKLTDADIDKITAHLTDNQRHVADELQKLMSEKMAAWGNEASMNVLGIELFGEPDYFPIRSDKAALEKDLNADEFAQAIRNFGFTKAVQPGARNAIMIDDIFDVVAEHCNNMNLYNSYSETMNDFMKVYNYRDFRDDGREYTVQQAIAHAYSQKATTFIMTFMRDLNGNVSGRSSAIEDAYNYMLGNAKKAAVFANLRVAAQQPTALVRAFAEIDPKYLKGIRVGQGDMKEMFEHCPIALWKSWGYYDINMGKSIEDLMMNNGSWLEDKATDMYGKLDNITWTAIWQMVKAETRDKHPELKEGTDEFFEHCNERMSEIVDLTQVVDSPMHRSHEMRSKGVISKLATAFMAEPTLTFNMVKSGYRRSIEAWKSGDKKKAIGIAQRTFNVFVIQAGTVALSAALVDALRHKKPDKDDEDERFLHLWWVNTIENFHDNIKLWNNIYYVKDIVSMFEGWENTNLGLQGWKNLATGWNQLTGNGYVSSSKTWYENMAYGLGYIWGIPTKTMMTGISNALNMFGLTIPGTEAVTDLLDSTQEAFQSAFQKDDMEVKPEGMAASLIGVVLSDDKSLMDSVAEKMGYKRIEASASTDKSSSSTDESEGTSYSMTEDDLPDNLTDEQKKDILKAGEKRAKKAEPEEEQEQLDYDKMLYDAMKAAAGLEGEEYNKKVYSSVAQGLKGYIADGDYTSIGMMRTVIEQAGGDVAYFDQRVMEETKSAYKKTLVYAGDMYSPEGLEARNNQKAMFRYMMNHGMTQEELSSEVLYHSELAKDMKVAYRVGDNDLIYEAMLPLVDAGITELDLERLYENRNKMDLTKYKQNGRFKDKLKSMGTFIWPTEGVITSHFGYRNAPTAGASSNHPAIDIGAPMGTAVVAADGGVVISAGANGGYGNSVGIKHDNGMITWYNHLSAWNVKVGDTVGQGQQIAQVGSTGVSTGPHLDFKIVDKNGKPVDPEKYLNKR